MEQQLTNNTEEPTVKQLTISDSATYYLTATSKWTYFLSIMGFLFIGFIIMAGIFASSMMSLMMGDAAGLMPPGMGFLFGGIYVVFGILYLFPTMYLLKFSQKTKLALATSSNEELNVALSNQKSFFKFWGILTIVVISLYALSGIVMVIAGAFWF
ncbi:DUF5362 family protein [Carboxylicivirga marina]|uniref:DUF5362 domain-containing protein n=1 Tax=Carboxylicivirga marina TaxID=2800988 RepID=A0ABS1HQE3_9BACT|nr:DUF5362 family protein [Carboxylicivirga marina]MBK3519891.1 hypothetical protein [Carboxylicivirga marina]